MGQVATVKTPLSAAQALGSVLAAAPGLSRTALDMIAAQSAVETAAWKAMNNYNFGNVTPTQSQLAAGVPWMDQGIHGMKYIAFPDPVSGAQAMLGWLSSHGLLAYAQNGDLDGYMAKLRAGCYLGCIGNTDPTGHTVSQTDYDNYRAGIASYMSKLSGVTPVTPPMPVATSLPSTVPPWLVALGILGAGAAAGYVLAETRFGRRLLTA